MTNRLRDVIGVFLVIAFVGIIVMLLFKAIPKDNEQLIVYMLGQLSGFVAGVVAFHYVTKAGEKELEDKRADLEVSRAANTGKALDAIKAATESTPGAHGPAGTEADPIIVAGTTGDAPPVQTEVVASPDTPAGTESDPLIVAGAPEGSPPVHTKDAKP